MTMKNFAKCEKELTCHFKIDTTIRRFLTQALGMAQKFALLWAPLD